MTDTKNNETRLIIDFNNLIVSWLNKDSYESSVLYDNVVKKFITQNIKPYNSGNKKWSELLKWSEEKTYALNFVLKVINNNELEYLLYAYSVVRYLQKIVKEKLLKWNKEFDLYEITKNQKTKEEINKLYYKVKTINQIYEKIWDTANHNNLLRVDILIEKSDNNTKELVKELIWFINDKIKADNTMWNFKSDIIIFSDRKNPDKRFSYKIRYINKVNIYKTTKSKKLDFILKLLEKRVEWFETDIILSHSNEGEYLKILEKINDNLEAGIFVDFIDETEWVMSPHYVRSASKMYDYIVSIFKYNWKEEITETTYFQNIVNIYIWFIYILYKLYDNKYLFHFVDKMLEEYKKWALKYSDLEKIVKEVYKEDIWWNNINVKKLFENKWFYIPSENNTVNLIESKIKWDIMDYETKNEKKVRNIKQNKTIKKDDVKGLV